MHKLSWTIAVTTAVLITMVIIAVSVPLYWYSRTAMENQLSSHMKNTIRLLRNDIIDLSLNIIREYPQAQSVKDSLVSILTGKLRDYSASSIYILDEKGVIFLVAGNRESAVRSVMLHEPEKMDYYPDSIQTSPLFSYNRSSYYKSAYLSIRLPGATSAILAIDADADFLHHAAELRRQIVVAGLVVLTAGVFLSLLFSGYLTRPLSDLARYAEAIGRGHRAGFAPDERADEIGFLSKTMHRMAGEIDRREKETKQLVASIAHEIKNPLGGMRIHAELIKEETDRVPELSGYIKAIVKEIYHLNHIVESFLMYARPDEHVTSQCNLRSLLEESVAEVRAYIQCADIVITGDGDAEVHPEKIKHVFNNLIRNAAEASPVDKAIRIDIRERSRTVAISFINHGKPIAEELQPQIFDAFFSTKPEGVGLGLSISRSIVEQLGGDIYLEKSDNSGTHFVVNLIKQTGLK